MREARNSPRLINLWPSDSRSNWNLELLVFEEGKTGVPGEKPLGARTRTNNKLNPHMTPSPGIKPGPHWWEACVGGKMLNHCAIPAPLICLINYMVCNNLVWNKNSRLSRERKIKITLVEKFSHQNQT